MPASTTPLTTLYLEADTIICDGYIDLTDATLNNLSTATMPNQPIILQQMQDLSATYETMAHASATYLTTSSASSTYASLAGTNTFSGTNSFTGNLTVNNETVNGTETDSTLIVTGNSTLGSSSANTLACNATATFNAPVTANSLTVTGTASIPGYATLAGTNTFSGTNSFTGNLTVNNETVNGTETDSTLIVTGNSTLGSSSANTLTCNATATFNAPVTANSLTVTGTASIPGYATLAKLGNPSFTMLASDINLPTNVTTWILNTGVLSAGTYLITPNIYLTSSNISTYFGSYGISTSSTTMVPPPGMPASPMNYQAMSYPAHSYATWNSSMVVTLSTPTTCYLVLGIGFSGIGSTTPVVTIKANGTYLNVTQLK